MAGPSPWQPPRESARRRHSIFVDVELWDDRDGQRTWSCPMLAAVWQLMRLGLLRDHGRPVLAPQDWRTGFPDSWDELPPVIRLNPGRPPSPPTDAVGPCRRVSCRSSSRSGPSSASSPPNARSWRRRRAGPVGTG